MDELFAAYFPTFVLYHPAENPDDLATIRRLYVANSLKPLVARRVLDLLGLDENGSLANVRCRTVLLETGYVDRDRSEAYQVFYSRQFRHVNRRCLRFHFFSEKLAKHHFVLPSAKKHKSIQDAYLGFSIIHDQEAPGQEAPPEDDQDQIPGREANNIHAVHPSVVGRTVIKPLLSVSGNPFVMGFGNYRVNVAGYTLNANGVPFVQQDGRVAACASCTLWMALASLSRRFGQISLLSPSAITRLATENTYPRQQSFLSPGLQPEEMIRVINHAGYDPYTIFNLPNARYATRRLSKYLASHIPVILILELIDPNPGELHSVIAFGNVYDINHEPQPIVSTRDSVQYYASSEWVRCFVIHDDQSGPYHLMSLRDSSGGEGESFVEVTIDRSTRRAPNEPPLKARLAFFIVPLPQKVYLAGVEAEDKAITLLRRVAERLPWSPPSALVMHTYMVTTNEFKHHLMARENWIDELSPDIASFYRGKGMYRLAWVVEFGPLVEWRGEDPTQSRGIGEILLDTTSTVEDSFFMTIHIPEHLIQMFPKSVGVDSCIDAGRLVPSDSQARPPFWSLYVSTRW